MTMFVNRWTFSGNRRTLLSTGRHCGQVIDTYVTSVNRWTTTNHSCQQVDTTVNRWIVCSIVGHNVACQEVGTLTTERQQQDTCQQVDIDVNTRTVSSISRHCWQGGTRVNRWTLLSTTRHYCQLHTSVNIWTLPLISGHFCLQLDTFVNNSTLLSTTECYCRQVNTSVNS